MEVADTGGSERRDLFKSECANLHGKSLWSCRFFATLWTISCQASVSMGFSRPEYWSGLLGPPPEDLPDREIKSGSAAWQDDSLPLSHQGSPKFDFTRALTDQGEEKYPTPAP